MYCVLNSESPLREVPLYVHVDIVPLICSQVTIRGNVVCVVMNGVWNYPGVDYIWKRIFSEVTVSSDDVESE